MRTAVLAVAVLLAVALSVQAVLETEVCGENGKWLNASSNEQVDCVGKATCFCATSEAAAVQKIGLPPGVQTRFRVGVLAIRGIEAAYSEFNQTFSEYLSCELKCRFNQTVTFEMVPLNFKTLFSTIPTKEVDFIYVNPSAYSCIESEWGASSLVSQIGFQKIGKDRFQIQEFGGVIFTLKSRADITSLRDIKDKSVAAASISGLGSGQAQFLMLVKKGMSFINDPSQIIFTSNQGKVVKLVEKEQVDVGYVRTNQLEKMDAGGKTVMTKFKIIETWSAQSEGKSYPFPITTDLYPEWNLAALSHVHYLIMQEVQAAMLRLKFPHPAANAGNFKGWRPTLSYMMLRNMQEDVGFIAKNPDTGDMQCIRGDTLWDSITCPPGHFKLARNVVAGACAKAGKKCEELDEAFQCVCKPCKKAVEVEIEPVAAGSGMNGTGSICSKMSVCGSTEQGQVIRYLVTDNRNRIAGSGLKLEYGLRNLERESASAIDLTAAYGLPDISPYTYGMNLTVKKPGMVLMEVYANGQQISESPFFVQIRKGFCADRLREMDEEAVCRCVTGTTGIGSSCVELRILVPAIVCPGVVLLSVCLYAYIRHVVAKRDAVWVVDLSEIDFGKPVEVLGRGTFGMVLRAKYRGTSVAVKRVIPPRDNQTRNAIFDRDVLMSKADSGLSRGGGVIWDGVEPDQDDEEGIDQKRRDFNELMRHRSLQVRRLSSGDLEGGMQSVKLSARSDQHEWANLQQGRQSSLARRASSVALFVQSVVLGDEHARLRADFIAEMRTLSKLRHPCITTVMGAVVDRRSEPMMVMELMDYGSLYDLLHNDSMLIEGEVILPILKDVALGLHFLHAARPLIVHGDLKSANVLVDDKFRAKVADFGLSQKKNLNLSSVLGRQTAGPSGTPFWMAPELLNGEDNTTASDVYAYGIVLFEVYSRQDPYAGEDPAKVLRMVADPEAAVDKRPFVPSSMPQSVVQMMRDCWHKLAGLRPSFEEIERRLKTLTPSTCEPLFISSKRDLKEQMSTDAVLYDVFPPHIADALRNGQKIEPERKDMVTIFFSDIVGFTEISSTLDPVKISHMLDRLYTAFDELSRALNVFKVETIGDAYMAVTNLVEDQHEDHALRLALFATGAIKAAQRTPIDVEDPSRGNVRIRVGLHSGPVVANVVGSRNLRYCLFGDTVNTASRMESNSEELKIHMSERAAVLLKLQIKRARRSGSGMESECSLVLRKRGDIEVKGKGRMVTYWVHDGDHNASGGNLLTDSTISIISQAGAEIATVESGGSPTAGGVLKLVKSSSTQSRRSSAPMSIPDDIMEADPTCGVSDHSNALAPLEPLEMTSGRSQPSGAMLPAACNPSELSVSV